MLVWLLPVFGCVVFLSVFAAYNRAAVLRDWEFLLSADVRRKVGALEESVAQDHHLAERAHRKARGALERADREEAVRMLGLAALVIREAIPDRLTRLKGMAVCCRMASALIPLPPLLPRDFKLRRVATIAGAGALLHAILVGMDERFRLRLFVLRLSYQALLLVSDRSAAQVASDTAQSPAWSRFSDALGDFKTLDAAHVESFRALLVSMAATELTPGTRRTNPQLPG
jgi:hypothetical protein